MTWLNAMNDRGMGRGAKIVSGTVRDSLHMIDVIFGLDGGDTGSYSDVVFGLLELLGISYRPALADLPCSGPPSTSTPPSASSPGPRCHPGSPRH